MVEYTGRHQTPGAEQRSAGHALWCARNPDRPPPGELRGLRAEAMPQTPSALYQSCGTDCRNLYVQPLQEPCREPLSMSEQMQAP